jgi:hypothetical protein
MAPLDPLSLEECARTHSLAYAAAEGNDDGFREDLYRLLDERSDVLEELVGRNVRPDD